MFFSLDDASRLFLGMDRRYVACEMWTGMSGNIDKHFTPEYVNTTWLYKEHSKNLIRPGTRTKLKDY